jgi:hypothetical protein
MFIHLLQQRAFLTLAFTVADEGERKKAAVHQDRGLPMTLDSSAVI